MSTINLRVNTDVMKDQSNLVRNDVKNTERHWNSIGKLIKESRNYWEGEASDAHYKLYKDMKVDVDKVIKRLNENPVKLQMEAGVYDEAEKEATAESQPLQTDIF